MQKDLFLSTDLIEPGLRSDYWREVTRPLFDTRVHEGDEKNILEGSLSSQLVGTLLIARATFNRQRYERDRRIILQSGLDDYYLLQLFLSGMGEADCEGRTISFKRSDICVFDLARTWTGRACPGSTLSIVLPRDRLDEAAGERSLHGVVLEAESPITRLLADFIVSLSEVAAEMASADALAIERAAIALLASGLVHHAPHGAIAEPALGRVLRRNVLEYTDANLSDPDLGPAMLMRRFRVSRAHLYRMFAADGGVATIVRERRLNAAYRELTRPGPARSITEIAHDLGFSGSSQFLRAFRSRFDMTPSKARKKGFSLALADRRLSGLQTHFAKYSQAPGRTKG